MRRTPSVSVAVHNVGFAKRTTCVVVTGVVCRRITKVESVVETPSMAVASNAAAHTPSLAAMAEAKMLATSVESEVCAALATVSPFTFVALADVPCHATTVAAVTP